MRHGRGFEENDQTPFLSCRCPGTWVPTSSAPGTKAQFTLPDLQQRQVRGLTSWLLPIKERAGSGEGAWIAVHILRVTVLKWALLLGRVLGKWSLGSTVVHMSWREVHIESLGSPAIKTTPNTFSRMPSQCPQNQCCMERWYWAGAGQADDWEAP